MSVDTIDPRGTRMGDSADCEQCKRQVHTKGMIGGGWRVDGVGGSVLMLEIQTAPMQVDNRRVRIVVTRKGEVMEVMPL